ncbi:MAG: amidase domain-containing protein [Firmicutes bacterium]|nr:amidase domain-containing protein [Bacillota bacterium]
MRRLAWFLFGLTLAVALCASFHDTPAIFSVPHPGLEPVLHEIAGIRLRCLLSGDARDLEGVYDTTTVSGTWAFEHEVGRVRYFREWLSKRLIEVVSVDSSLKTIDAGAGGEQAWASICHNVVLTYRRRQSQALNHMGVRTVHWMELVRMDGRWLIRKDWFWDPLGSSSRPRVPAEIEPATAPDPDEVPVAASGSSYNRTAAVEYADRYCGVKTGTSTGRYNPRYRDFTNLGGDCANFASQVLADREAGGLPMDGGWFYEAGEGTDAWIRSGGFVGHMLYNGRATLVKRGKYSAVAPLLSRLQPGDIIAYEELGAVKHVCVVTGRDADGRVVVNSHTADRYHVPWDLGSEDDHVFWLIHITG